MQEWFTPAEILEANRGELPDTLRSFNRLVSERGWRGQKGAVKRAEQRGGGYLYHVTLLPKSIQVRLQVFSCAPEGSEKSRVTILWERYEALPETHKKQCMDRLSVLHEVAELIDAGASKTRAVEAVAASRKVAKRTLFDWQAKVKGFARSNWLAALAPEYHGKPSNRADIHPDAWSALKSDFLRPEKPTFSACFRRVAEVAEVKGWGALPTSRSLRRRLDAEVPKNAQIMKRSGRDAIKATYPAQRRTRNHFHAMQAVNADGHKFDVFVRKADGKITRFFMCAIQDLYSGKMLSWRLAESENKETVRLVIGDMVEKYGIPEQIYLDNGRSFASKWITGGTKTRYRFKIRDEEPSGLLVSLGVNVHWTTPYSGQSKPIERAFLDLTDTIARHPFCAGAYTGNAPHRQPDNYGQTAIDEDIFRDFVDDQILRHNQRVDRNTQTVKGESFDQAFMRSLEQPTTIVRWPTAAQKALWMMAADQVRARKGNGEIHFYGNRYWHPSLSGHAGKAVTVRFDPDKLKDGIRIYDTSDQFLCEATLVADARFDDVNAAKEHAKNRSEFMKLSRKQAELHATLDASELAEIYKSTSPKKEEVIRPAVPRLVTEAGKKVKRQPEEEWDEANESDFAAGLRLVAGSE